MEKILEIRKSLNLQILKFPNLEILKIPKSSDL
jgi:hypothetical protein